MGKKPIALNLTLTSEAGRQVSPEFSKLLKLLSSSGLTSKDLASGSRHVCLCGLNAGLGMKAFAVSGA